jgi:hypothetical protein
MGSGLSLQQALPFAPHNPAHRCIVQADMVANLVKRVTMDDVCGINGFVSGFL